MLVGIIARYCSPSCHIMSFAKAASFIKVRNSSICIILSDRATSGEFYSWSEFFKNWFAIFVVQIFF